MPLTNKQIRLFYSHPTIPSSTPSHHLNTVQTERNRQAPRGAQKGPPAQLCPAENPENHRAVAKTREEDQLPTSSSVRAAPPPSDRAVKIKEG